MFPLFPFRLHRAKGTRHQRPVSAAEFTGCCPDVITARMAPVAHQIENIAESILCPTRRPFLAAFHAWFTALPIVLLIPAIALRETLIRVGFLLLAFSFGPLFPEAQRTLFPLPGHPSLHRS